MSNTKILIVHNYYQIPRGEDAVVANEKKMLEDHGHTVILYSRNNAELKEMSKLKKMLLPITAIFNFKTYSDIKKIIKNEKITVVHVHNTLTLISPAVYYAARTCNVPVVQTIHNFRLLCPGATFYRDGNICEECVNKNIFYSVVHGCYRNSKIQTLLCALNTKIHRMLGVYGKINYICLTEFNKKKLLMLKQIDAEQIYIKPNFALKLSENVLKERENCVIFVGGLDELKGIKFLFEAWRSYEKEYGDSLPELHIYGKGPLENWCSYFVNENSLKKIKIKGFVSNEKVVDIIAAAKALILPTQWYEGFPMTIVEAYSVGTPVLGSEIGNVGSLIENGRTGYTFVLNDEKSLFDRLMNLESFDYEYIQKMYNEKYSSEANYRELTNIYDAVRERKM